MSFRPPWDHYKPQDLFYGTQRGRGSLIEYIRSVVAASLHWPHYVDTFTLLRSQGQSPPPPTGRWRYIVYDANFIESLLSHEKYKSIVGHDYRTSLPGAAGMLLHQSVMRRQSKGMLFHVVQRTNWTIHFSLDSLSIENEISKGRDDPRNFFNGKYDPLGKAPVGMPAALKTRSITGSELRWIFRHRHDARVQQQIQFWKKVGQEKYQEVSHDNAYLMPVRTDRYRDVFEPCPPPWLDPGSPANVKAAFALYEGELGRAQLEPGQRFATPPLRSSL